MVDPAAAHIIGVGPWEGELPTETHYDPELLAEGDKRNVADKYRYWSMDAIIADLDERRQRDTRGPTPGGRARFSYRYRKLATRYEHWHRGALG